MLLECLRHLLLRRIAEEEIRGTQMSSIAYGDASKIAYSKVPGYRVHRNASFIKTIEGLTVCVSGDGLARILCSSLAYYGCVTH